MSEEHIIHPTQPDPEGDEIGVETGNTESLRPGFNTNTVQIRAKSV